ncbi:MAG: MATE family efflux transporter [Oscillospiraceae bacterium]|nr:MATE family efflux transporter [Oscillospiraceae bacterium]
MIAVILSLAWPTMLEQLMQTAVQYIDTAMVGSLGTQATAAVGATATVNWLLSSSISALSIGFLAFIAKSCGAKDRESASKAVAQAVMVTLVVGIVFTVLTLGLSSRIPVWMQVDESIQDMTAKYFFILYMPMLPRTASIMFGTALRAAGDTRTPMKVGVAVNIINVVLNFIFIYQTRTVTLWGISFRVYGMGWGVLGAAAASAIAFTVGGIYITAVLWKHPVISPKGNRFAPDRKILIPCLKVAVPNMLQRFGTSLGYVAFASMINSVGEIATAAHTIANTVESAFYIPGFGMQTAAATLAGNAYGAKDKNNMQRLAKMFIPLEIVLMIISGAALYLSAPVLVDIFSDSSEVISLGTRVLRMVALSEPFYGFSIIVEGFMMGVGRTKTPFAYNIMGMWGVRIVGTFICTQLFGLGLVSAWACMIAHNLFVFVLYMFCYIKGKWNPLKEDL